MKPLLALTLTLICFTLFAQTPQAFNYQGVARDLSGTPIVNQNIGIRISILLGSSNGALAYAETHSITTSDLGLFNVRVGMGNTTAGAFETIDWGSEDHFLQIELDEEDNGNYTLIGVSQLLSVPYAQFANNGSKWKEINPDQRLEYAEKVTVGSSSDLFADYNININESLDGTVGLSILNSNPNGRSILLAGEQINQQYTYLGHNGANWNPQFSAFQPRSGVLFSGGDNGLNLISPNGGIKLVVGGLETPHTRLMVNENGNVGIGSLNPRAKLQVSSGDVYLEDSSRGVIMKSPNGQCWRLKIDNAGQLQVTPVACP